MGINNRFFEQFGGVITVSLEGRHPERLMNMALSRGIYIRNIKPFDEKMVFEIRSSGYEALKAIAAENGYKLSIVSKHGLPVYKSIVKRRVGFILGGLFFVIALYIITSFIWFVELDGNERIDPERILSAAARHGVRQGAPKWTFNRLWVEEQILRDIGDLSYIKIDIRGVRARIEVVEKIVVPEQEITGPSDMVAARNGIVEKILVLDGQASVEEGQVVSKGDILISGYVTPILSPYSPPPKEPLLPYQTRARGVVKARVWYEGYGECPMKSEYLVLSGHKAYQVRLLTPLGEYSLWGRRRPQFEHEEALLNSKSIKTPVGSFALTYGEYREQRLEIITHSESAATEIAREKALESLESQVGPSPQIVESKISVLSYPSDAILRIKIAVEIIEDIAISRPISENSTSL